MRQVAALKDERLNGLADRFNVARFFSVDSDVQIRFAQVGTDLHEGAEVSELVEHLLALVPSVNVRTFLPNGTSRSTPFLYGVTHAGDVVDAVRKFASEGYFCLVNETIDVHDGGVSGVVDGDVVEFGPDDTPRGVEGSRFWSSHTDIADKILSVVYDMDSPLRSLGEGRIEFSLHPREVGTRKTRVVVWESGPNELPPDTRAEMRWPNAFGELVGDKTLGLLLADAIGAPVARAVVIPRRIPPFTFGRRTGKSGQWLRTAPRVQQQGRFTTVRTWEDPFQLVNLEDPSGAEIAAVISQAEVPAAYSGATLRTSVGTHVEGVAGIGDGFMLGVEEPEALPTSVVRDVVATVLRVEASLGYPISIEWAHDGDAVWIMQMHVEQNLLESIDSTEIPDGGWVEFDPLDGIPLLAEAVAKAQDAGAGVLLTRRVGLTSHIGDLLRRSGVKFKFQRPSS